MKRFDLLLLLEACLLAACLILSSPTTKKRVTRKGELAYLSGATSIIAAPGHRLFIVEFPDGGQLLIASHRLNDPTSWQALKKFFLARAS